MERHDLEIHREALKRTEEQVRREQSQRPRFEPSLALQLLTPPIVVASGKRLLSAFSAEAAEEAEVDEATRR